VLTTLVQSWNEQTGLAKTAAESDLDLVFHFLWMCVGLSVLFLALLMGLIAFQSSLQQCRDPTGCQASTVPE
jgi:hypothetical protein